MEKPQSKASRALSIAFAGGAVSLVLCSVWWLQSRSAMTERADRVQTVDDSAAQTSDARMSRRAVQAPAGFFGRIFTPDGAPVANAQVCVGCANCDRATAKLQCASSNAAGDYAITPLSMGGYVITAFAKPFALTAARKGQAISLAAGEHHAGLDITLASGSNVSGVVLDALGGPVAHASVRVMRAASDNQVSLDIESDTDGRFAAAAPSGPISIKVSADGYSPTLKFCVAPCSDLQLVLQPGALISGRVVSVLDGQPLPGVQVQALLVANTQVAAPALPTVSDETGAFEIKGLSPGSYVLSGESHHARGQTREPIALSLGQNVHDVVLEMSAGARVQGRVTLASGEPCRAGSVLLGVPIAGLGKPLSPEVLAKAAGAGQPPTLSMHSLIDEDGAVQFNGVPKGPQFVTVQCRDHVLESGPEVVIVGTEDVGPLSWQVEPGLGLIIDVVDARGAPVPQAAFALYFPPDEQQIASAMPLLADERGHYEMPGTLYPGVYTLRPNNGYEGDPVVIELRPGARRTHATLRLAGSGALLVDVHDTQGGVVNGVQVIAHRMGTNEEPALAATSYRQGAALGDGVYRIAPLAAGQYAIRVGDGSSLLAPTRVPPSGVIDVRESGVAHMRVVYDAAANTRAPEPSLDGHAVSSAQATRQGESQ